MSDDTIETPAPTPKKPRGLATLSPERRAEISSMGGKAAHAGGNAHQFTSEEAREAGIKGGKAPRRPRAPKPQQEG